MYSRSLLLFVMISLLLMSAPPCSAETGSGKHALLIGIDRYISNPSRYNLEGCEHDVDMMQQMLLERFRFSPADIVVLKSRNATLENIRKSFREHLIAKAKPGDLVFIHYSGHGTRTRDLNGDEEDGFDEALCPTDCDIAAYPPVNLLLDDEVGALIDSLKTDNIVVVLDSCYSGTATKALDIMPVRRKVRFMEPPSSDDFTNPARFTKPALSGDGKATGCSPVVLSACSPIERASEGTVIRNGIEVTCGLMIKYLYRTLCEDPSLSYWDAFKKVKREVMADNPSQTPQIEGKSLTRTFCSLGGSAGSVADNASPEDSVKTGSEKTAWQGEVDTKVRKGNEAALSTVSSVKDGELTIDSGLLAGTTPGSRFTIYDHSAREIGEAEAVSCRELTSSAKVVNGGAGIAIGCPVREVSRCFGAEKLDVAFAGNDSLKELQESLKALPYIRITDIVKSADRIIAPTGGQKGFGLYAADGTLLRSFSGGGRSADELVTSLQSAYLINRMKSLSSPDPSFRVRLDLDEDRSTFAIGDKTGFTFKADRDCHLLLLHISTEGIISVLFPNSYEKDSRVRKGQVCSVPPFRDGRFLFNYRLGGPPGQEMVQAIATESPLEPWGPPASEGKGREVFSEIKGDPAALFDRLMLELGRKLGRTEPGRNGAVALPVGIGSRWASDSVTYVIREK
jgi:hypothetical protein